jgi:16S rRNA U1498 N3-methylase RsmE
MHRFYISPDNWNPAALTLSDAEAHHARDVLRLSRVRRFRRFTQIRKSELKERRFATAELINGAYKAPLLEVMETLKSAEICVICGSLL